MSTSAGSQSMDEPPAPRRGMTVGVLTNPRSGGNRKGGGEVGRYLARHPEIHRGEAVTPSEVAAVLADFARRGVDLLVVNGGDGTVQAVLTALYGEGESPRPPLLALLRGGTTSMNARDVGLRARPAEALASIRSWAADPRRDPGAVLPRPVLRVRQGTGIAPVCGMFFGAGAIVRGIDLWHGSINPRGVRGELMPGLVFLRFLLAVLAGDEKTLSANDMEMRLDDSPAVRGRCVVTMVSTLERLFLGADPFWGDEAAPLRFTAVSARPTTLLRHLPRLLRGRRVAACTPENGFFSRNARRIVLDFRGRFTVDGEIHEAREPLTIEPAGPARFLRI